MRGVCAAAGSEKDGDDAGMMDGRREYFPYAFTLAPVRRISLPLDSHCDRGVNGHNLTWGESPHPSPALVSGLPRCAATPL
jgi:hypothetical protein